MRTVVAVVLSLVASCSSHPTVLDVHAPAGTANIEMLIANDCTTDGLPCSPGIVWDAKLTSQPPGHVFELDRPDRNLFRMPSSGHVRIAMRPGDGDVTRLVLVAFDANDVPLGLVRLDSPTLAQNEVWNVTIGSFTEIGDAITAGPTTTVPDTFRAHVWRPPMSDATHPSCVATQNWDATHNRWQREFYVPDADHDCDDEINDCDPDWYQFGIASTPAGFGCTGKFPPNPSSCELGHPTYCIDGSAAGQCGMPTDVRCIPDLLCTECPLLAAGCGAAAFETQLSIDSSQVPFTTCEFPYDTTQGNQPCGGDDTLTFMPPVACTGMVLYAADWPPGLPLQSPFAIGNATIEFSYNDPCTLQLKFGGIAPTMLPTQRFILGIETSTSELLLPLSIRFSSSCPSNPTGTCSSKNLRFDATGASGDNMWSCAL